MSDRTCGECTLCCKLQGIHEMNKITNHWCQHARPGNPCGNDAFFRPNENFFTALSDVPWRYKRYVDVGCGAGHLVRIMRQSKYGFEVHGIDMYARDRPEVDDIQIGDACSDFFEFGLQDCMIFARPCHDGFVSRVLDERIEIGDALYVGLMRNVETDLDGWACETLVENVGEEGEVLLRILGRYDKLENFEITKHPSSYSVVASRECLSDLHAYCTAEEFCRSDTDMGWIAPDGTWYGCEYFGHDRCMQHVIGIQVRRGEGMGFVRCAGSYEGSIGKTWSFGLRGDHTRKPTIAQVKTLKMKGYTP